MKFFVFALLVTVFGVALAEESVGYFRDPAHPGKCVHEGLVLSPGEEGKIKGKCVRLLCGNDGFGTLQGCGPQVVSAPCKMGDYINLDAPYPACCKRHIICP